MLRPLVAASLAACLPLPAAAAELIVDGGFAGFEVVGVTLRRRRPVPSSRK